MLSCAKRALECGGSTPPFVLAALKADPPIKNSRKKKLTPFQHLTYHFGYRLGFTAEGKLHSIYEKEIHFTISLL